MGIDLRQPGMFNDIRGHIGHDLECVRYGLGNDVANVAIECVTCSEVLLDADRPTEKPSFRDHLDCQVFYSETGTDYHKAYIKDDGTIVVGKSIDWDTDETRVVCEDHGYIELDFGFEDIDYIG